jgi:hypothetical protein
MHNAGLHRGLRERHPNRFGQALQAIDDGHEDVVGTTLRSSLKTLRLETAVAVARYLDVQRAKGGALGQRESVS